MGLDSSGVLILRVLLIFFLEIVEIVFFFFLGSRTTVFGSAGSQGSV
jgi:hypothetical protein